MFVPCNSESFPINTHVSPAQRNARLSSRKTAEYMNHMGQSPSHSVPGGSEIYSTSLVHSFLYVRNHRNIPKAPQLLSSRQKVRPACPRTENNLLVEMLEGRKERVNVKDRSWRLSGSTTQYTADSAINHSWPKASWGPSRRHRGASFLFFAPA